MKPKFLVGNSGDFPCQMERPFSIWMKISVFSCKLEISLVNEDDKMAMEILYKRNGNVVGMKKWCAVKGSLFSLSPRKSPFD